MPETFLTVPEAARLVRVAEMTVYSLARAGQLPGAIKVGNQWRIERACLLDWARGGKGFNTVDGGSSGERAS